MHKEEISEFSTKISDLNESITTLTTERDDAVSKLVEADASISSLNNQIAILSSFKAEIETKEKEAIVAKYAQKLDADIVATYYAKLDEYSDIKSLEKDLAYELVSGNQSVFSAETAPKVAYVPRDTGAGSSLEGILDKYKK
jgi:chromosome segregation ATPase